MAVIQISRVQVRRGKTLQTGFPQLASGEFGWSVDQQELYIGNGSVGEGAPAVGNTRIITEHDSNFFLVTAPSYIYQNSPSGPTIQTGPNDNPYITRYIQGKLDDRVNLRDFGGVGDGVTDDTSALQRAISHVAKFKKVLDLNEGVFRVTSEILVPPYAELRGAGPNKTVLLATTTTSIFRTVGADINGNVAAISSAASTPQNVNISGMTFVSTLTNAQPMLTLDSVKNSTVENCEFRANTAIASTSTMAAAISMKSTGAIVCEYVQIKDSTFNHLGTAIVSDYDLNYVNIEKNNFYNVDEGIIFFKDPVGGQGSQNGPNFVEVTKNNFDTVNKQALFVGQNITGKSDVHSSNNTYIDVGIGYNNPLGDLAPVTEVIAYKTFFNVSDNDTFGRLSVLNTQPLSAFTGNIKPLISGPVNYSPAHEINYVTVGNLATTQVLAYPRESYIAGSRTNSTQIIDVKYVITRNDVYVREGTLELTIDNSTGDHTMNDTFTCVGNTDGNIAFIVDLIRTDVAVIKAVNSGAAANISITINVRQ